MLARIKALRSGLRRSEQKVADLVLNRPNAVISAPIATIAEEANVSEPTVIRFCRAIGCAGFQDFKLRLAGSLASGIPYIYSGVNPGDRAEDLSAKIFDRAIATLVQVRNHVNTDALERAITLLANADRIEFYGHGASGIVAQDAQHKFFRLGVPTVAYTDPHIHSMSAAILKPGSAVVAISHTGRSADIVRSAELAREAGADVVAITACGSPLAEVSSVALFADVSEDTDTYTPMTSRIAHLTISDILAVGVALRRGPDLVKQLEKTKRNLAEKRVQGDPA
ncbi:RpiR family carbohydrate utilization transcriptional regulator [Natronocella acetinitrilica]|uniref:RpiR family carbohydrate utilization transcriptional regulator n=1 Tax=Natronocella acetinitrilica TaxID=414046 RepID=A0AAE3KBQ0_9GAMM|nr:transcriptional regulator HexR [Natronocella acetinitrilica]MCP1674886.1 RpiR family carbohydrate utilization transcriptional regulator [Natronocella acetinitrilica]